MKEKLLLIDGTGLLTSAFHATYGEQPMRTSKGEIVNAVYGMTLSLQKLFRFSEATHVVVVWDVNRNTFRKELYKAYKENRGDTNPDLKSQFKIMKDLLEAMNIFQFSLEGYEADDVIGSLAKRFEKDIGVLLVTKDRDYLQLISENTRLWLNTSTYKRLKEEYYGTEKVANLYKNPYDKSKLLRYNVPDNFFEFTIDNIESLYGVSVEKVVDYKALEGDKSDNIPGVKGVGEKAIIPLLNEFGNIEEVYEYIENTNEKEIKEFFKELGISRSPLKNLLEYKEEAFLSKRLSAIKTDISEVRDLDLSDFKLVINEEGKKSKFIELEFNSLLENE